MRACAPHLILIRARTHTHSLTHFFCFTHRSHPHDGSCAPLRRCGVLLFFFRLSFMSARMCLKHAWCYMVQTHTHTHTHTSHAQAAVTEESDESFAEHFKIRARQAAVRISRACVCACFVRVVGVAQSSFDPPYIQHGLLAQPLAPAALIRHADCTALNQRTRTGGSVAGVGLHSRHARPSRRELIDVHAAHARSACTRDTHDRPA